ncbi:MAG: phytanoyl-CoA dioxygenase family protein [Elusimicrobiota bacterium]|nr:phytanoyl-CoA dioxygenase family protein [Elusimicrobiota bacterium]
MSDFLGRAVEAVYASRARLARLLTAQTPAPDARAARLAEDGLVVLPGLLDAATVARIRAANAEWFDFDHREELVFSPDGKQLLEAAGATRAEVERYYFLHVKNYQRKFDLYRVFGEALDPVLRAFYGARWRARDIYCYRNQPVPAVQGSYAWHRDNYPTGSLKVMTYLTPVRGLEDGPLTVAKGSQKGFKPELGKVGDRYEDAWVKERFELVHALGEPGTVIVFENNAVHRAWDPARGFREALNFTVFPSVLPPEPSEVKGLDLGEEAGLLKKYTR